MMPKSSPVLDVSNENHLELLKQMLLTCKPIFGLPCGTCSRARNKPLPKHLGTHGPPPLRDQHHLEGFPALSGTNKAKVVAANRLYKSAVVLLQLRFVLQCFVSIENPLNSWLWPLLFQYVLETNDANFIAWYSNLVEVCFSACAHGSQRDKKTKLLSTQGLFPLWR